MIQTRVHVAVASTDLFDEFLSHGGTEARRFRIQIPVNDPGHPVAHQRFTEMQQAGSQIPVQLNRTVDHDGPYRILVHLRVFVPP